MITASTNEYASHTAVSDGDYSPTIESLDFYRGDITRTHTILIPDDGECEDDPNEEFYSVIALVTGVANISVTVPRATVAIDDSEEIECGRL